MLLLCRLILVLPVPTIF